MHCNFRAILLTLVCGVWAASDAAAQSFFPEANFTPEKSGWRSPVVPTETAAQLFLERFRQALVAGDESVLSYLIMPEYGEIAMAPTFDAVVAPPAGGGNQQILVNRAMLLSAAKHARAWQSMKFSLGKIAQHADPQTARLTLQVSVHETSGPGQSSVDNLELHLTRLGQMWKVSSARGLYPVLLKRALVVRKSLDSLFYSNVSPWWTLLTPREVTKNTFVRRPAALTNEIKSEARHNAPEQIGKKLFEFPFDAAFYAQVKSLNSPPYQQSTFVQMVTDPASNRIVYGDYERWGRIYAGGVAEGKLNRPQGIDRDSRGIVYVADTGNNRVLVLEVAERSQVESGPADLGTEIELRYLRTVGQGELSRPFDVAWDDRGTPFDSLDDMLWVVDQGKRRLVGYRLQLGGVKIAAEFYGIDSSLQNPVAVAVGRFDGASDGHLYVADDSARVVYQLFFGENKLRVQRLYHAGEKSQIVALATDHWGNLYLSDQGLGRVIKLSPQMEELATLEIDKTTANNETPPSASGPTVSGSFRFSPIFAWLFSASNTASYQAGFDQAILLNDRMQDGEMERYQLGINLNVARIMLNSSLDTLQLETRLTDVGRVQMQLVDASNQVVHILTDEWALAGSKPYVWDRRGSGDRLVAPGFYRVRYACQSTYGDDKIEDETPEFYLPLLYWEDSGAKPEHDAHLVQGTRNRSFGLVSGRTVATDPRHVVYRFDELMSGVRYEVRAEYFSGAPAVEQRLLADNTILHGTVAVGEVPQQTAWLPIDDAVTADGVAEIVVEKTGGDGAASLSQLWLREANFDPRHLPPRDVNAGSAPVAFDLKQNDPNPFSATGATPGIDTATTIEFSIPPDLSGPVTLRVFDVQGQPVRTLVDGNLRPGTYTQSWNGADDTHRYARSGIYFYSLTGANFQQTKKLVLMK
ncbi:T9SS type A sorting domain-containing protein [candidate division KSB1 bacterium]|nr:T9SS type A sorting domain-containing protein [candidate division KSB1 bacterium]